MSDFLTQLSRISVQSTSEVEVIARLHHFIECHGEAAFGREIAGEIGHITSAAFIANREKSRVLLVFSAKENGWKLPGAHVENEKELFEVAIREANRVLESHEIESDGRINSIRCRQIEEYWNTPSHWHFEVLFGFVAEEKNDLTRGAQWFSNEEARTLLNGK